MLVPPAQAVELQIHCTYVVLLLFFTLLVKASHCVQKIGSNFRSQAQGVPEMCPAQLLLTCWQLAVGSLKAVLDVNASHLQFSFRNLQSRIQ